MAQPVQSSCKPDQASRLRRLVRRRKSDALTISVLSGKGGVGKTNIAVNLSVCLSGDGHDVALVDADLGLANADILLNVRPRYTLSHLVTGIRSLDEVVQPGPGGIHFIAGGSGVHHLANLSSFERHNLLQQLKQLQNNTDIIVFDCGAGVSSNVTSFALAADWVVVITTPQPTAITDAYATIKELHRERSNHRIGLFVNMAESQQQAIHTYQRVAGVAKKFLNYLVADCGYMLHDTTVEQAVQARCPFVIRDPSSNASACISALARTLVQVHQNQRRQSGFLKRVAGLFV